MSPGTLAGDDEQRRVERGDAKRNDRTTAEMFSPAVLEPTVDFLASLARAGAALEFAIGTGRVVASR